MNWTLEAKNMLNSFPLYARFISSKKIEEKNKRENKSIVDKEDVINIKKDEEIKSLLLLDKELNDINYLQNLEMDICGGIRGCRLSKVDDLSIAKIFYKVIEESNILKVIEEGKINKTTKHRRLKASISGCPNSCSKSQIQDISVVGYIKPILNREKCISCMKCEKDCPVDALDIGGYKELDLKTCIGCGNCVRRCPTGALQYGNIGYRILIGGRLGKNPKLANIYSDVDNLVDLERELNNAIYEIIGIIKDGKRISDVFDS